MEGQVINRVYVLRGGTAPGPFGESFLAEHTQTGKLVSAALEPVATGHRVKSEGNAYRHLIGFGVPAVFWRGHTATHEILVHERLDRSLAALLAGAEARRFSLKTVLALAAQGVRILEHIHAHRVLHRDIRPEGLWMGAGESAHQLFLLDYSASKRFVDPETLAHIPYAEGKEIVGSVRFASINAHLGLEQSRRDDLEMLGYVIVYLANGSLPWQGAGRKFTSLEEKQEGVLGRKLLTSHAALCGGLPPECREYFRIVRNLEFDEKPPYAELVELFQKAFRDAGFADDQIYDWTEVPPAEAPPDRFVAVQWPAFGGEEITPDRYIEQLPEKLAPAERWNTQRRGVRSSTMPRSVFHARAVVDREPSLMISWPQGTWHRHQATPE
jgi:serine/threonine protein kinase